ncbi:hypothetical protein AGMMS49975_03160 [Clostridia bacterium]|nr:hypothetical protein AGMMS49975_03160 [Clostridia bacterium]
MKFRVFAATFAAVLTLSSAAFAKTDVPIEDYIISQLKNFEETIDLSEYAEEAGWGKNDMKTVSKIFVSTVSASPEIYFLNNDETKSLGSISFQQHGANINYSVTDISYSMTREEYEKSQAVFNDAVDTALEAVTDDMSDFEKALALHDYIVLNTSYDHTLKKSTSYNALVEHEAVCQGYAEAYVYLLNKVGIKSLIATSASMNHAWVLVKLGDFYYHVDPTWDDPSMLGKTDMLGHVSHEYFLLSDEGIRAKKHNGWTTESSVAAPSVKYDKAVWRNVDTEIVPVGDLLYFAELDENSPGHNGNYKNLRGKLSSAEFNKTFYKMYTDIKSYDPSNGALKTVHTIDSTWFTDGSETTNDSKSWTDATYVSLASYNDKIYFNTAKGIYSLDPSDGTVKTIAEPTLDGKYIFGIKISGDTLTLTLKTRAGDADTLRTIDIKE